MLLARIAAELRADAELASCLLPVRFMEESDEVFSAADFWLEALFYLALAIDKPSPEFARSLRDTREDLASRWREWELDERARAAVLEAADTLGMRLVLMVENLQALCANADADFGWKLRKTLHAPELQAEVATALFHKGMNQIRNGRADEALLTADQLDRRRQAVGHDISVSFNWNARYVRMSVRLSQGSLTAAVDAFCSLYAAFAPENETMIPELVEAVAMLATAGVPERELVEVLRSEPQKAACVAPLSIALRQRDGERVRAPAEVLAVAADVRKRIDETGLSPLSTIPKRAMASAGAHRESETWVLGVRPPAHRPAH